MDSKAKVQYFVAVLLVVSSIALAFASMFMHDDVPSGCLLYIAQAFLLAGSIFGLDYYYVKMIKSITDSRKPTGRSP